MGKQQPLRPIKFGERRSPAGCQQLEGAAVQWRWEHLWRRDMPPGPDKWCRLIQLQTVVTTQVIMFILFLLPCKIINSWISMSDQILFDQFSTTHRLEWQWRHNVFLIHQSIHPPQSDHHYSFSKIFNYLMISGPWEWSKETWKYIGRTKAVDNWYLHTGILFLLLLDNNLCLKSIADQHGWGWKVSLCCWSWRSWA